MNENVGHIFRFWTWKKFVLNFICFVLLYLIGHLLIVFIEGFKYKSFNYADLETFKLILLKSLFLSILTTVWTNEQFSILEKIYHFIKLRFHND